jgi:diguanylate cyclase (GGDEF)-like protein
MNAVVKSSPRRTIRVLVADDEAGILDSYREILLASTLSTGSSQLIDLRARLFGGRGRAPAVPREEFDLVCCTGASDAVAAVGSALALGDPFDVVFLDMRMPPGRDGVWAAAQIRELDPLVDIVIATAFSDVDPEEIGHRVPPMGSLFYVQKPFHVYEVRQLASALGRRRQAEERIRQLAYYDQVTGLPNRALFKDQLDRTLIQAQHRGGALGVLFLDLDNFKRVNDTLGHSVGDVLLTEVAKRLLLNLRMDDSVAQGGSLRESEVLARLGGDEFTVILNALHEARDAGIVARRLLDALAKPLEFGGHEVTISASIGIAVYPDDGSDAAALLKHADTAMYHAKDEGRNNWQMYRRTLTNKAAARLAMETDLRQALEDHEFRLVYQPQVEARDGRIVGMEALIRWQHPERGLITPADFIPVAEESGLIVPIGHWVIRTACQQVRAWQSAGVRTPRVAVNLSARQVRAPEFVGSVLAILAETGISAELLELELTESILMDPDAERIEGLHDLRARGVHFSIDDFGTGYSSMAYIKRFPIGMLKIDQSFVRGLPDSADDAGIVTAILAMARSLRLDAIAEGVETSEQSMFLQRAQCPKLQGYLFSRPLAADAMEQLLRCGYILVGAQETVAA